jgi:hypothetical protein
LSEAEAARDDAIHTVRRGREEWIACALAVIGGFSVGYEFNTDDLWPRLAGLPDPGEPRVMGAVMADALRVELVESTGFHRKSRYVTCHARPKAMWRRTGNTMSELTDPENGQANELREAPQPNGGPKKPKRDKLLDVFGNQLSDSYCSPRWLTELLPQVNLDPCSNPRSTVKARRTYSMEKKLDGLKLSWNGSVFVNWPYSDPLPWAQKTIHELRDGHCTDAIVLCKLDTSTEWWHVVTERVLENLDLWAFDKRIQFDEPPELVAERIRLFAEKGKKGGEKSSNNFCSAIIHHRGNVAPLDCLAPFASRWSKS